MVARHSPCEARSVFVAILQRRAPRTGYPAPQTHYNVPWDSPKKIHDRMHTLLAGHVRLSGAAHHVAPIGVLCFAAEVAVLIGAVLNEDPLNSGPRGRDSQARFLGKRDGQSRPIDQVELRFASPSVPQRSVSAPAGCVVIVYGHGCFRW